MTRRDNSPAPAFILRMTLLLPVSVLLASAGRAEAETPLELKADPEVSDTGYFRLTWKGPKGVEYELQESSSRDFSQAVVICRGPDRATVLSGKADGVYYYRVRKQGGPWSSTLPVTVRHHALSKSILFMGLGFAVFLVTALLIILGHARQRKEGVHG